MEGSDGGREARGLRRAIVLSFDNPPGEAPPQSYNSHQQIPSSAAIPLGVVGTFLMVLCAGVGLNDLTKAVRKCCRRACRCL